MTSVGATNGTLPEQVVHFSLKEDSRTTSADRPTNLRRLKRSWTRLGIRLTPVYTSGFQRPRPRFIMLIHLNRSASGRGFPDVAAQGLNFQVMVGGKLYAIGGTSASAPVRLTRTHLASRFR